MTSRLAFDLRGQKKLTSCVAVKIRYTDFNTYSLQKSIPFTAQDGPLLAQVKELFGKLYQRRQLVRLIGVKFTNLVHGHTQISLFEDTQEEVTALLATYSTFQFNAAVRELGKVFGLPKEEIDHFADDVLKATGTEDVRYWKVDNPKFEGLAAQSQNSGETGKQTKLDILKYARLLHGFPNHLGIHAGGVVISERPIFCHTALQLMPKGFPISHFDMNHAEDFGFHKFDVLSQRGLGHIKDAVALVKKNQGRAVDIHDLDHIKQDAKVREQLRSGHCIGCFYIESPAMRGLLHKLRCDTYVHLVAASSIIRPGVAKSGMMREYNPKEKFEASGLLFADEHETFELPELSEGQFDQAFDEIELLGFHVGSPYDLLEKSESYTGAFAAELKGRIGRMVVIEGFYVARKDVRTVKGEMMHFGTWLDREGKFFDTVHFPAFAKMSPFRGKGIYRIEGNSPRSSVHHT